MPTKLTLAAHMASPERNAYIRFEGLESYVTKIQLSFDGVLRPVLCRSNTRNVRRSGNMEPNPRRRSTGQYGRLDAAMTEAARVAGMHGVAVQGVVNRFLSGVLTRYGYTCTRDDGLSSDWFKEV